MDLDTAAGVLYPFYDGDLSILYLAGKGDGNIRYYEFMNSSFHNLSEFKTPQSGKAYGFVPKRVLDVTKCEIAKAVKITDSTLEFISFVQPRKVSFLSS